jgi:hypothetical protein
MLLRREFLKMGAVATAQTLHPGAHFLIRSSNPEESDSFLAKAAFIWPAQQVPVPLISGGEAEKIASSSNGVIPSKVPDLHAIFSKSFSIHELPSLAQIHLMAFTRYRLYVNGEYVGRGPSRYQNQRPEYDTRDLMPYLKKGPNRLVVLAHRDAPTGRIMLHEPGMAAVLEWKEGGTLRTIATDASWLSMPELSFLPRAQAWSSIEEHIDARRSPDWLMPDNDLADWKPAVIVASRGSLLVWPRTTPLQTEKEHPFHILDKSLPVMLKAGDEITFRADEILQGFPTFEIDAEEGSLLEVIYQLPQNQVSGISTYICRKGRQIYMGGDTFAIRDLKLRFHSGSMTLRRVTVTEVRYPFERAASFECSDAFHNRLWTLCARSLEILSEDAYVDCADRERVEWTDCSPPAFDCTRVMMRGPDHAGTQHWGDSRLLQALLRRIALTQLPNGQMKAHSCSERFDIHAIMEDRTCDWVVLLREYFESTGDKAFVKDLWPALLRLLAWYQERRTPRGLVQAREWEVWDNPLRYQICEGAGLNAMYYRALSDAVVLAGAVGMTEDLSRLQDAETQLRNAFNSLLWNQSAGAYCGALFGDGSTIRTQDRGQIERQIVDGRFPPTAQANLFALYAGVVPNERLASVRSWVLAHRNEIKEPMSHYYLFRMLYAMNCPEQDRQALERMKEAWTNQVESEWGTAWEELEDGGGSKVHVYGMLPGFFLTAYILGARRVGPAADRLLWIEPRYSGLNFARGVCVTEFGPVKLAWERTEGMVKLHCEVPDGLHTRLRLYREDGKVLFVDGQQVPVIEEDSFIAFPLTGSHAQIEYKTI